MNKPTAHEEVLAKVYLPVARKSTSIGRTGRGKVDLPRLPQRWFCPMRHCIVWTTGSCLAVSKPVLKLLPQSLGKLIWRRVQILEGLQNGDRWWWGGGGGGGGSVPRLSP